MGFSALHLSFLMASRGVHRGAEGSTPVLCFVIAVLTPRGHIILRIRITFLGELICDHGSWPCLVLDQHGQMGVPGRETGMLF